MQHVGAGDDKHGQRQPGLLAAGEGAGELLDRAAGEQEGPEDVARLLLTEGLEECNRFASTEACGRGSRAPRVLPQT